MNDKPNLGLATTRELLEEISARIELNWPGGLEYRTVDEKPNNQLEIKWEKTAEERKENEKN